MPRLRRVEQLEQRPLLGVVRAGRIAGRRADAAVRFRDQRLFVERFVRRVAPELAPHALVQQLGERLGEAVGERLEHDRVVVVVRRLELAHPLFDADARGDREGTEVVGHARRLRRDEVGKAEVGTVGGFLGLLAQAVKAIDGSRRPSSA